MKFTLFTDHRFTLLRCDDAHVVPVVLRRAIAVEHHVKGARHILDRAPHALFTVEHEEEFIAAPDYTERRILDLCAELAVIQPLAAPVHYGPSLERPLASQNPLDAVAPRSVEENRQ